MNAKPTPGPWTIKEPGYVRAGEPNFYVGYIYSNELHSRISLEEGKANQRLIAAAPDLLEACKMALERLVQLGAEDEPETLGPCPACKAIRTAITKATGKDSTHA
jgi:hypothetical protein